MCLERVLTWLAVRPYSTDHGAKTMGSGTRMTNFFVVNQPMLQSASWKQFQTNPKSSMYMFSRSSPQISAVTFRAFLCGEQHWLQSVEARTTTVESTLTRAEKMDKEATTNDNSVCTTWRLGVTFTRLIHHSALHGNHFVSTPFETIARKYRGSSSTFEQQFVAVVS